MFVVPLYDLKVYNHWSPPALFIFYFIIYNNLFEYDHKYDRYTFIEDSKNYINNNKIQSNYYLYNSYSLTKLNNFFIPNDVIEKYWSFY